MRPWNFPYGDLTQREEEALWLYAAGCSDPRIAQILRISVNSVRTYFRRAAVKLDAPNRPAALAFFLAIAWGKKLS